MRSPGKELSDVWVEDKGHALTIHYRGVPDADARRVQVVLSAVMSSFDGCLTIRPGKACLEVLPAELEDKGAAVKRLMARLGGRVLPVYVGDDCSDEPAFAALSDGVTVCAGCQGPCHARYRVAGPPEVRTFLQRLASVVE
jgi:trehalose 6-phosphate phosphatase